MPAEWDDGCHMLPPVDGGHGRGSCHMGGHVSQYRRLHRERCGLTPRSRLSPAQSDSPQVLTSAPPSGPSPFSDVLRHVLISSSPIRLYTGSYWQRSWVEKCKLCFIKDLAYVHVQMLKHVYTYTCIKFFFILFRLPVVTFMPICLYVIAYICN